MTLCNFGHVTNIVLLSRNKLRKKPPIIRDQGFWLEWCQGNIIITCIYLYIYFFHYVCVGFFYNCIIITNSNDMYARGNCFLHVYFLLDRNLCSVLLKRVRCKTTGHMLRCPSCTCYNNVDFFIFDTDSVPYGEEE